MKKTFCTLLALSGLVFSCGSNDSKIQNVTDNEYGYSLNAPGDWHQSPPPTGAALQMEENGGKAIFVLEIHPGMTSMDNYYNQGVKYYTDSDLFPNSKIVQKDDVKVSDLDGKSIVFTWTDNKVETKNQEIFLIKDNLGYLITFKAPLAEFDKNQDAFNLIQNSLNIQ